MLRYQIPDEPRPGPLRQLVVAPTWPLLATMLAGCWLAWPWFCFNGLPGWAQWTIRYIVPPVLSMISASSPPSVANEID